MEFQSQQSYITCGNGCNAHFQCVTDESKMHNLASLHDLNCTKENPYKNDPNAFYFVEPLSTPSSENKANWTDFNSIFRNDRGYDTIAGMTTNQRSVTRMEALAIARSENFPLVKFLWDEIVTGLAIPPRSSAIKGWNAIALECFMPFEFDESGKMILL